VRDPHAQNPPVVRQIEITSTYLELGGQPRQDLAGLAGPISDLAFGRRERPHRTSLQWKHARRNFLPNFLCTKAMIK
jgi:hypothetical protein